MEVPIVIEDQEQGFACADRGMGGCSWSPPPCLPSSFPSLVISHPLNLVINVEESHSTIPFHSGGTFHRFNTAHTYPSCVMS